ncbi:MAG: OsmC family protein [Ectothiorhodospiraceae bacterium]|jgi:uncharacterized OsmC-like protein
MEMKDKSERRFSVHLDHLEGFRFRSQASEEGRMHGDPLISDEPDPVGDASGPATPSMLGAAIGHCLSASLLECLRRARVPVTGFGADVDSVVRLNDEGLPRIDHISVTLRPSVEVGATRHGRCEEVFQKHCTVCSSVKEGIDVDVQVDWQFQ